jgi:hypothetical protein
MNDLNPIGRMAAALERDIESRKDLFEELKEGTEQLRNLNQRLSYLMIGLTVFGGSTLSIGVAQNQNIQDLPKEIPQVQIQKVVPKKAPTK